MADPNSRSGRRYDDVAILDYVANLHAAHDPGLAAAFDAPQQHGMPAIQVNPSEGKLLELLVRLAGAGQVAPRLVEIGTLAGYSAIRMARALPEAGQLWTVENDPKHYAVAVERIAAAGLADRVQCVLGAALEILPSLTEHGPFDLIFLDADKGNYDRYARWALDQLRPGGLLVGDNAFFFGQLLSDSPEALAMRRFHEMVARESHSVCIPTPDGLVLGFKR